MPNETLNIFNGTAQANQITLTDGFINVNYIYLVFNGGDFDVEIDISLQVYLTPTIQRAVRLENDNILNTVSISLIPQELVKSPFNMRVAIITNINVNISIFAVRTECCGEQELNTIKFQLNKIEAYSVISGISDTVTAIAAGFTAFTLGAAALPLLGSNLLRRGLSILLPAITGGVGTGAQILFDAAPQLILASGQYYVDETGFTGAVSALSLDGSPIEIGIREYT